MKKQIAFPLLAMGLAGCAAHPQVAAPHAIPLTQASLWLNHSAAVASTSLKHLDQITEVHLKNPAVAVSHVSTVSGVTDKLTLHWSGPVNLLMAKLAQHIGWRSAFAIHPQPMPDVALWDTNTSLPAIVHQINRQMQNVATLRILPLSRTLELIPYEAQWLPQHPVLPSNRVMQNPPAHFISVPLAPLPTATVGPILTVGKNGTLHPLEESAHGPHIPLQKALNQHWKLVMPKHPNSAENQIAQKWMAAGGVLYRPN